MQEPCAAANESATIRQSTNGDAADPAMIVNVCTDGLYQPHSFAPAMCWSSEFFSVTRHHFLRRHAIILPPFHAADVFRLAATTAAQSSVGIWPLPLFVQSAELSAAIESSRLHTSK